jgi:hypothetical protein
MREYIDCSWAQPASLVLVVASHCLAVVPQSGAKDYFYCTTVYYITLNPNCEALIASKDLKKKIRR